MLLSGIAIQLPTTISLAVERLYSTEFSLKAMMIALGHSKQRLAEMQEKFG